MIEWVGPIFAVFFLGYITIVVFALIKVIAALFLKEVRRTVCSQGLCFVFFDDEVSLFRYGYYSYHFHYYYYYYYYYYY